jgi:transposase InsO family protein
VVLKATKDVTATETVYHLAEFVCNYGKPKRLITDRGTAFTAAVFEQFCRDQNIVHVKVSSKNPRSNGQAEIINGVVVRCLAMTTEEEEDRNWDLKLMEVQWSLNNSESRITKNKPFNLVHNYLAEGLITNSLAVEVAKINEKKNQTKKVDPTILLKKNKDREQCKISERTSTPTKY